ncbi:MAG: 3-hydroxyacyl-ACP dehydratase FabZ [Deltaproteobacteria bacterium]|nr:3-hydroxyacyl-ACP dehydratase FabZ [Deltaproteobacteria bacterium]
MSDSILYDISIIEHILPHRSPFLFVDRVTVFIVGDKIITEKDLGQKDPCFSGHFPGNPIMPGVLVSEALAQTSGLLLGLTWKKEKKFSSQEKMNLYLAAINIKFLTPAKPGETLRLKSHLKKEFGSLFLFDVSAFVEDRAIAEGTLTLAEEK